MQIDIDWLRRNFGTFNSHYFDGLLPVPHFHVGHSRTQLGSLSYKRRSRWGRSTLYDFTLTLSNYYDQTELQFQSVLLHEMIHLSIAVSGVRDTSPHGVVFRGMMERLNRDGWTISVTQSTKDYRPAYTGSKTIIRQYLVLALHMRNGKRFLSSVNPRFARDLDRQARQLDEVETFAWFTTSDHWFDNMPRVRTLRGRLVSEAVYIEMTAAMTPIQLP